MGVFARFSERQIFGVKSLLIYQHTIWNLQSFCNNWRQASYVECTLILQHVTNVRLPISHVSDQFRQVADWACSSVFHFELTCPCYTISCDLLLYIVQPVDPNPHLPVHRLTSQWHILNFISDTRQRRIKSTSVNSSHTIWPVFQFSQALNEWFYYSASSIHWVETRNTNNTLI